MPSPRLRDRTRRALRRSRKREEAMVRLAAHAAPLDLVALARELRVSPGRALAILRGGDGYRPETAPVRMGTVVEITRPAGPAFALSERGRAEVALVVQLRAQGVPL